MTLLGCGGYLVGRALGVNEDDGLALDLLEEINQRARLVTAVHKEDLSEKDARS